MRAVAAILTGLVALSHLGFLVLALVFVLAAPRAGG